MAGKKIPDGWSKGRGPVVRTVEDLTKALKQLPPGLPIGMPSDDGFKLVIFNKGYSDMHLALEENDGTWDPEDE